METDSTLDRSGHNRRLDGVLLGIVLGTRLLVGLSFFYAGIVKIRQPYIFLETIYSYELFSPSGGLAIAMLLPWIEVCTGVLLLSRVALPAAFSLGALLSASFVLVQAHALQHGLSVECGCFGSSPGTPRLVDHLTLARAAGLGLAALVGFLGTIQWRPAPRAVRSPLTAGPVKAIA